MKERIKKGRFISKVNATRSRILIDKAQPAIEKKYVAGKMQDLQQLREIHTRDNADGISTVFKEPVGSSKSPRITQSKKIIQNVCTYLEGNTT
jgi:hypothetical protein